MFKLIGKEIKAILGAQTILIWNYASPHFQFLVHFLCMLPKGNLFKNTCSASVKGYMYLNFDILGNIEYSSMVTFTFVFLVNDRLVRRDKTVPQALELLCYFECFSQFLRGGGGGRYSHFFLHT